jgi:hypothetical protein
VSKRAGRWFRRKTNGRPAENGQSSFKVTSNRVWLDKIEATYRRRLVAGLLIEGVLDVGKDNVALGALAGREAEAVCVALEHAGVLATDENLWARGGSKAIHKCEYKSENN